VTWRKSIEISGNISKPGGFGSIAYAIGRWNIIEFLVVLSQKLLQKSLENYPKIHKNSTLIFRRLQPGCVSHTCSWAQKPQLAPPAMWQFFGQKTIISLRTFLTGINWLVMLAWKFSSAAREHIFEPKKLKIDNFVTFSPEIAYMCATSVHKLLK
jgi:hypothetical protein